jgi:hypothetical protein
MHRPRNDFGSIAATAAVLRKFAEAGKSFSCRGPVRSLLRPEKAQESVITGHALVTAP